VGITGTPQNHVYYTRSLHILHTALTNTSYTTTQIAKSTHTFIKCEREVGNRTVGRTCYYLLQPLLVAVSYMGNRIVHTGDVLGIGMHAWMAAV
jgi:hypothetical protein